MDSFGRRTLAQIQLELSEQMRRLSAGDKSRRDTSLNEVFSVLRNYDRLAGEVYKLRAEFPRSDPRRARVEDFIAEVSEQLGVIRARPDESDWYPQWLREYRTIWREELGIFVFCVCLFLGCGLIGWNLSISDPSLVPVMVPQQMMELVLDHEPWFKRIQENPMLYGLEIAWNNIRVAISCFTLGALFGLGGLAILCFNGVHFGALLGYCRVNGFESQLTEFVVSHGPLELTIIVAAAFASLLYGRVFFMRPYSLFRQRFRVGAHRAFVVITGITPWLILAACLEVFVSPWNYLDVPQKMVLGWVVALWFWVWTFWPVKPQAAD